MKYGFVSIVVIATGYGVWSKINDNKSKFSSKDSIPKIFNTIDVYKYKVKNILSNILRNDRNIITRQ